MDDFGTGYSSLSYLERLPVDLLKIDRSFTASLGDDREIPVLLRSIIKLGQTLRLQVLAEGIERGDQVVRLRELGCRLGQGYHFSPPLPADAVPGALARRWEESLSA
jgi:sensor c-di-GMP phosphodiesterase-like protein